MSTDDRKPIEQKIRQLSFEIYENLLDQQRQKIEYVRLDLQKLEEMMSQWALLTKYYEKQAYEPSLKEDTEISLFIVNTYFIWTQLLQSHLTNAAKNGFRKEAEEIDEYLSDLEYRMKDMLTTLADFDEFRIE